MPVEPAAWPTSVGIEFDNTDCPYFTGSIFGPGEAHDYAIDLTQGQRLSVFVVGTSSHNDNRATTVSIIDPRDRIVHSKDIFHDFEHVVTAALAGTHIVRVKVNDDHDSGSYDTWLYLLS